MNKFKIGDRVEIVSAEGGDYGYTIDMVNQVGNFYTIYEIPKDNHYNLKGSTYTYAEYALKLAHEIDYEEPNIKHAHNINDEGWVELGEGNMLPDFEEDVWVVSTDGDYFVGYLGKIDKSGPVFFKRSTGLSSSIAGHPAKAKAKAWIRLPVYDGLD